MSERPDIFNLNGSNIVGLMKDEYSGYIITEAFLNRSKSYHYVLSNGSTVSKHKGVSKGDMKEMASNTYFPSLWYSLLDDPVPPNEIFDPMTQVYWDCIFNNDVFYAKNIGFRSKDYVISLVEIEKKAIAPINDKKWVLSDCITSLLYGYWRIEAYKFLYRKGLPSKEVEKRAIMVKLKA